AFYFGTVLLFLLLNLFQLYSWAWVEGSFHQAAHLARPCFLKSLQSLLHNRTRALYLYNELASQWLSHRGYWLQSPYLQACNSAGPRSETVHQHDNLYTKQSAWSQHMGYPFH